MRNTKDEVVHFWFEETTPGVWFQNSPEFIEQIKDRFTPVLEMLEEGLCENWDKDAEGALALCLLYTQFPRKLYAGKARAYETDTKARLISKKAIHNGFDQVLSPVKKRFLYLPFKYSENLQDQRRSVDLFKTIKHEDPISYENAVRDCAIIEKFGRFPRKNDIFGRESTHEELEYLNAA